jgi:hypothetical protein
MSQWMDAFLDDDSKRKKEKENDAKMLGLAISSTPVMTARLAAQILRDVKQFAAATGDSIQAHERPGGVQVARNHYPNVFLDLQQDQDRNPVIHCTGQTRIDAGNVAKPFKFDIQIIAKSQTALYYRSNGEDLDEGQASEEILKPLLKMIIE